jgi:hypothetical protein
MSNATSEMQVKIDAQASKQLSMALTEQRNKIIEQTQALAKKATKSIRDSASTSAWGIITPEALAASMHRAPALPAEVMIGAYRDQRLNFDVFPVSFPAILPLRSRKGLFFQSPLQKVAKSEEFLQAAALRILCSLLPGSAQIHLIDLKTKGRAFAALSGLDPKIAPVPPSNPRDITELLTEFEQRVADVNRRRLSRYEWLCHHNTENPDDAEPYHFVCISDFPAGLEKESIEALERLLSHECAARAGIYFFISSEKPLPMTPGFSGMPVILTEENRAELKDQEIDTSSGSSYSPLMLVPDALPKQTGLLVDQLSLEARTSPQAKKIAIQLESSNAWKQDATRGISVPIGKAGRQEMQLVLGNEAAVHHALIGGATGSGKTVLLHNIILHAAELYSPQDLQMLLMDFKEGTEFACYENLPHMRVLAIASEIHFGLNVLEWLMGEKSRRATLYKKAGVGNLSDYAAKTGQKMPRLFVLMDEFQRLLSEPSVSGRASMYLDDLVRTGRSFGINLVLATQSLANVAIESSTLEQLGLRICLRLSESEAIKFLSYDNTVAGTFRSPGQAVYNDSQGHKEGNTEFNVAFVNVAEIPKRCDALREKELQLFGSRIVEKPRVFHGDVPVAFPSSLQAQHADLPRAYIGEPKKVDGAPISLALDRADGANILVIGQDLETLGAFSFNLVSQFSQSTAGTEIVMVDALPQAKDRWAALLNSQIRLITSPVQVNEALENFNGALEARKSELSEINQPSKVLLLVEPQLNAAFPASSMDSSPAAAKVNNLLDQGPRHGIHVVLITSRLARTDKVLGLYGSQLNTQYFAKRVAFKSDEAERVLGYGMSAKITGSYSGCVYDESAGESIPFQIFDNIQNQAP